MDTPTPPSPTVQALSAVDCYTCRRRRVRCDRVLPGCAKCARTQLDCLGYKKPLVWNKGVASRGKMMGKTFPVPAPPQLQSHSQFKSTAKEKILKSRRIVHYEPTQSTVVGDIAGPSPIEAAGSEEEEEVYRGGAEMEVWSEGEASSYASSYGAPSPDSYGPSSENSFQMVRSASINTKYSLSEIKPSIFVDIDATGRYYLDYCGFATFLLRLSHMWKVFCILVLLDIEANDLYQSTNGFVATSSSSRKMAITHIETSSPWLPRTHHSSMLHWQ